MQDVVHYETVTLHCDEPGLRALLVWLVLRFMANGIGVACTNVTNANKVYGLTALRLDRLVLSWIATTLRQPLFSLMLLTLSSEPNTLPLLKYRQEIAVTKNAQPFLTFRYRYNYSAYMDCLCK